VDAPASGRARRQGGFNGETTFNDRQYRTRSERGSHKGKPRLWSRRGEPKRKTVKAIEELESVGAQNARPWKSFIKEEELYQDLREFSEFLSARETARARKERSPQGAIIPREPQAVFKRAPRSLPL
jgi:hypothetical protein